MTGPFDDLAWSQAETEMTAAANQAVTAYVSALSARAVTELSAAADAASFEDPALWRRLVQQYMGPAWRRVWNRSYTDTAGSPPDAADETEESRYFDGLAVRTRGLINRIGRTLAAAVAGADNRAQARLDVEDVATSPQWNRQAGVMGRTATTGAYNAGVLAAARAMQGAGRGRWRKVWRAHRDELTRPTHRAAHGQERALTQHFKVGDARLQFPGDPRGGARFPGEILNCRCRLVAAPAGDPALSVSPLADESEDAMNTFTLARDPWPWPDQLLTAAADGAPLVSIDDDGTWTGTMLMVNTWSADMRRLALGEGDDIAVRPLPLPVGVQYHLAQGHDGAKIGLMSLDEVWRDGDQVMGRGRVDLDDPEGQALARKMRGGFFRFVSADIDGARSREVCVDGDGGVLAAEACFGEDSADLEPGEVFDEWRIMGATLLAHPAFPEAQVAMTATAADILDEDEDGEVEVEEAVCAVLDDGVWLPADCADEDAVPLDRVPEEERKAILDAVADARSDEMMASAMGDALTASGGWSPPAEWFSNPRLERLTLVTYTDDGRVFGHIAGWNTRHVSFQGQNIYPPKSPTRYERFHLRPIPAAGGIVEVGPLCMDTDHAGHGNSTRAVRHYDSTGSIVGAIRAGEDAYGIWIAGALLPCVSDEQRQRLALSAVSGDWRDEGDGLDLKAVLAVPAGHEGFYVPKGRRAPGDYALVASGALTPAMLDPGPDAGFSEEAVARIVDLVEQVGARRAHAARMAARAVAVRDRVGAVSAALAAVRGKRTRARVARLSARTAAREAAAFANWVDQAGGLPKYIARIADHLKEQPGWDESRAIATAVNAVKKMCATGDVSLPGDQDVNPGSRAEACAAVAEWEAKKAGADAG